MLIALGMMGCGKADRLGQNGGANVSSSKENKGYRFATASEDQVSHVAVNPMFPANAERRAGLSTQLAVFQRRRRPTDELPGAVAEQVGKAALLEENFPSSARPGSPLVAKSRLLLRPAVKAVHATIYGYPTTNEDVCYVIVGITRRCVSDLVSGATWGIDVIEFRGGRHVLYLHGLLADAVDSVHAEVDGEVYEAEIGENAFLLVIEDARRPEACEALLLTTEGGAERRIPLG